MGKKVEKLFSYTQKIFHWCNWHNNLKWLAWVLCNHDVARAV